MRVAYTLEQCWHRVPGGTAVAALEVARELAAVPGLDLVGVAGGADPAPPPDLVPPVPVRHLHVRGPRPAALYARWVATGRPPVERATGRVDVAHATTIVPCASRAPLVVTIHDLAFLHEPRHFSAWGRTLFARSLAATRRRAALVLCSSLATLDDVAAAGIGADRLRHVPLGVRPGPEPSSDDVAAARARHGLPVEYLLFVGTLEPRKNLRRLIEAVGRVPGAPLLAVVGPDGWGDAAPPPGAGVRLLGRVEEADKAALLAGAWALCYPSLREGFGLPVLEAMAHGTPVVTSRGTSTEEVAGGAAVLVDPRDVDAIAAGIEEALRRAPELAARGRARAASCSWAATAHATLDAYHEAAA